MSNEITNVSKLVPLTVLRNKQDSQKPAINASSAKGRQGVTLSEADLKAQVAESKADVEKMSLEFLKSAAAKGSSILQATNRNLEFVVDESTQKVVVKVVDSKSGDLVRQIPSEEMLAFVKRMQELEGQQGTMLHDKA